MLLSDIPQSPIAYFFVALPLGANVSYD